MDGQGQDPPTTDGALLELRHVVKHPDRRRCPGGLEAVDDVSLSIRPGETLGIVGETGSGASTLGRLMLRLLRPSAGQVLLAGEDIAARRGAELTRLRRELQMLFPDPYSSLNPARTAAAIIAEPYRIRGLFGDERERRSQVRGLMDRVGLEPDHGDRYPHEFSGVQRQRIAVARAVALGPKLLVAEDPVAALERSVQAQILDLLLDLKRELGLTLVLIARDPAVVRQMADRVAVMYLGRIVELTAGDAFGAAPRHPYTSALRSAVPSLDPVPAPRDLVLLSDESPSDPPSGCRFHPRCPRAQPVCSTDAPALRDIGEGSAVACHFPLMPEDAAAPPPVYARR